MTASVPVVLFLCVQNAGRSQMAAAWARRLAGDRAEVHSGGSAPADAVHATVADAMREAGIDLSAETPRPWTLDVIERADIVITMGCGDSCPVVPGVRYVDWPVDDPAGRDLESVRRIRDDIEQRVRALLDSLGVPAGRGDAPGGGSHRSGAPSGE